MKEKCVKISVDCQKNDPVDIRCGGPDYLGYDFFVIENKIDEMTNFITQTCDELNVPVIRIYSDENNTILKSLSEIWSKEKIYNCIKNNEAGLDLKSGWTY